MGLPEERQVNNEPKDEDGYPRECSGCKKKLLSCDEGIEMGTPSGYGDDYTFCVDCATAAEKNFEIAEWHDGGMVAAPQCGGDENNPHTCPFSEEERAATRLAFKSYQ